MCLKHDAKISTYYQYIGCPITTRRCAAAQLRACRCSKRTLHISSSQASPSTWSTWSSAEPSWPVKWGSSWDVMGKSWGNHGENHGENHGKMMVSWDCNGMITLW